MAEDQDVWLRYKPDFMQLYVVEGKSLKNVKAIMETKYGFPAAPLSTYESKLRDKLRLRKYLKAKEWSMIYNYVKARRLSDFDCYFHGVPFPPSKVRKELKRYGSKTVTTPMHRPGTLPDGIEVRGRQSQSRPSTPRIRIAGASPPLEANMPDAANGITSVVARSIHELSPASEHAQFRVNFGSCSPVNDWNTWGGDSTPGIRAVIPYNVSPTEGFMDEFIDYSLFSPSMSPTPSITSAGEAVIGKPTQTTTTFSAAESTIKKPMPLARSTSRDRRLYARHHLQNLPWIRYRLSLQLMRSGQSRTNFKTREIDGWSFTLMPADGFFADSHPGLPIQISKTSFPGPSEILESMSSSGALSKYSDPFHILAGIVYLFSNNLHGKVDDKFVNQLFNSLTRISRDLVFGIFKSNELSIRAAWENLIEIATEHRVRSGIQLLATIGLLIQPVWIDDKRDKVLFAAVLIGDTYLVSQLLDRWHSWNPWSHTDPTYFGAAASWGAIDCAKLLLEKCDPNATYVTESRFFTRQPLSIFILFLGEFAMEFVKKRRRSGSHLFESMTAYYEIFCLFVDAGADVDKPFPSHTFGVDQFGWDTTCLDICFYLGGAAFERASTCSRLWNSEITRAGVCNALLKGQNDLAGYLESRPAPPTMTASQCLRTILIEQFHMSGENPFQKPEVVSYAGRSVTDSLLITNGFRKARALLQYGISMRALYKWTPNICQVLLLQCATRDALGGDLAYLLEQSIKAGADITPAAYSACIRETGLSFLRILISLDINFQANTPAALLSAASRSNFEAVSFLLGNGADINSELDWFDFRARRLQSYVITVLSHLMLRMEPWFTTPDIAKAQRMWEMFVAHGAELRARRGQATCYQLLQAIIESGSTFQRQAFQFVLNTDHGISQFPTSKWVNLFELAVTKPKIDFVIVKTLFQHCGSISKPFLAQAILGGCDLAFFNDLLDAGQDVNEYSGDISPLQAACFRLDIDMATRLLERGAEINSPTEIELRTPRFQLALLQRPKLPSEMDGATRPAMTALQLACLYTPRTQKMRKRQQHLVKLLVNHGANINARAHNAYSSTALQLLCSKRYIDQSTAPHFRALIEFFIENGADVNIAPAFYGCTALQHCARRGDIEQLVILVENGADPNAHPSLPQHRCHKLPRWKSALDFAAGNGLLDMTQYLLNIEALSVIPGETGYQGALDAAIEASHDAVAEVIRNHAEKLAQGSPENPRILSRRMELVNAHTDAVGRKKAAYAPVEVKRGYEAKRKRWGSES